jgi:cystathionine beta-synthase
MPPAPCSPGKASSPVRRRARCSRRRCAIVASRRRQTRPHLVCDSGNKYLSKVYNDFWLIEQGLAERQHHGNLRDLVTRTHRGGRHRIGQPEDTLLTAYGRMRGADVSQLPVLEGDRLVGILDESDILAGVEGSDADRQARFKAPVRPP